MKNMFDELPWLALTPTSKVYTLLYQRAQKTNSMLLVSGAKGSGKSKMLRHLANELSKLKNTWIACVDARCDAPGQSIIDSLGKTDFSVNLTDYEAIILLLKQRQSFSQKTILLIDGSDCLNNTVFEMLSRIIEQNRIAKHHFDLSIVFFSENVGLKHFLNVSESIQARYALPPLNPTQIKRLAEHAYTYVGIKRDFSIFEVSKLHGISHGYPGRLLTYISQNISVKNNVASEIGPLDVVDEPIVLIEAVPNRVEKLYQHEVDAVHINKHKKLETSEQMNVASQAAMTAVLTKKKYEQRNFMIIFLGVLIFSSVLLFSYALLFNKETQTPQLLLNESALVTESSENEAEIVVTGPSSLNTGGLNQDVESPLIVVDTANQSEDNGSEVQENVMLPQLTGSLATATNPVLPTEPTIPEQTVTSTLIPPVPSVQPPSPIALTNVESGVSDNSGQFDAKLEESSKINEQEKQEIGYYVIRLSVANSSKAAKNALIGIPVPGSAQLAKISTKGRTQFITYIGPYSTKAQAQLGLKKLPTRLKELNPVIYSDLDLIKI